MEIFGYDFILDEDFNPWLIEVNTNPCLEESSTLLKRLIPRMIDDALKLTVDIIFPPKRTKISEKVVEEKKVKEEEEESFSIVLGSEPGIGSHNMKGPIKIHNKEEIPLIPKNLEFNDETENP